MKRTGILITTISSGLCGLISLFMMVAGLLTNLSVQHINKQALESEIFSEDEQHELQHFSKRLHESGGVQETIFQEMNRHGTIGFITSLITFIACFITLPNRKFLFPAIATGSASVGAIFCGWLIMSFLLVALAGIGLIVFSHYLESKPQPSLS